MTVRIVLPAIVCVLLYRRIDLRGSWLEAVAWSLPAAVGLSSVVLWGLMWLPLGSWPALGTADLAVWSVALAAGFRRRPRTRAPEPSAAERAAGRCSPAAMAAALAILLLCLSVSAESIAMPHGQWDAWAIWNLRARFLYRGYPGEWRAAFSALLAWSHVDYPLLLPLGVVRGWMLTGRETTAVPAVLAGIFALCTPVTAALSIRRVHSMGRASLAALAIVACPAFVKYAASQCADVPLGFFVLATCVAIFRAWEPSAGRGWWVLAGVAGGLAAWTKNEGLLFFLMTLAALVVARAAGGRRAPGGNAPVRSSVALFLAGAAPALAALVVLKSVAPRNDLLEAQSAAWMIHALGSPHRVMTVAATFAGALWQGGVRGPGVLPAIGVFLAVGGIARPSNPVPLGALAGMAALLTAYGVACVLAPQDVAWQLAVSVDRLVLHAFPTLVWAGIMITKS